MAKFSRIVERLQQRIDCGDYASGVIPPERTLAASLGACQVTTRKAIQQLVEQGVLKRQKNGRLVAQHLKNQLSIALLSPAWDSPELSRWNIALSRHCQRPGFRLQVVYFCHWDDPVIAKTISQYDATFFFTPYPEMVRTVEDLQKIGKPFFSLNNDWSEYGVPSLLDFPPQFVDTILDHLHSLGHRQIDCLNIQPQVATIPARIERWSNWLQRHGLSGTLYNVPVERYADPWLHAYGFVHHLLQEKKLQSTAIYTVTQIAGFATLKALLDHGIRPGKDVAVATTDATQAAAYSSPTLSSIRLTDMSDEIEQCLQWLANPKRKKWDGPLCIQPQQMEVDVRQSTVADIETREIPTRLRVQKDG